MGREKQRKRDRRRRRRERSRRLRALEASGDLRRLKVPIVIGPGHSTRGPFVIGTDFGQFAWWCYNVGLTEGATLETLRRRMAYGGKKGRAAQRFMRRLDRLSAKFVRKHPRMFHHVKPCGDPGCEDCRDLGERG